MSNENWQQRSSLLTWGRHFAKRWELIVLGAFVLLALALAILLIPPIVVQHEYWEWRNHPDEYSKHVDDYRKTLVQIIGGAFLLYGLYLTYRRTKATEQTLVTTQESLKVTRETQVTDRFTKAITQLGATDSQGKKQLEIRFGGIYSLERIARDSPDDHWPIMEILTAYVRENSPWVGPEDEGIPPLAKDIQAAMTVIGRRKWEQDKERILDLSFTDLRGVDLSKAYLEKANLWQAHLEKANLSETHLKEGQLLGAHMEGAYLFRASVEKALLDYAHLERANLTGAHLEGASMTEAHLEGAQLHGAFMQGAVLEEAYLERANLSGANLESANLCGAHLEGARLSKTTVTQDQLFGTHGNHLTQLPPGFFPPITWPKDPNQKDSTASQEPLPGPADDIDEKL